MRTLCLILWVSLTAPHAFADLNALILEQIRSMPEGGGYATNLAAHAALAAAVGDKTEVRPKNAQPSYCSGATYLVFLKALSELQRDGEVSLSPEAWRELAPRLRPDGKDTLPDGESAWGRWNANGPGTARLFYELGLGTNFRSLERARPGDFLKIFWTDAVGKSERGHSVVYLGRETIDGVEHIRFWSSNQPGGYGEKSVPRGQMAQLIFSRLENPKAIEGIRALRPDDYLDGLLRTESSSSEADRQCGIR